MPIVGTQIQKARRETIETIRWILQWGWWAWVRVDKMFELNLRHLLKLNWWF